MTDTERRFEGGTCSRVNGISVLNLHGGWKQMGRQYGALLREQLACIYREKLCPSFRGDEGLRREALKVAEDMFRNYPPKYKEFFSGMEETSGLTLGELLMDNALERICSIETGEEFKCSGLAVWGGYAKDRLVFGRNYDYGEGFREYKDFVTLTVFHPEDGSYAAAIVSYAGEIYCVNGMNEKGPFCR